MMKPKHVLVLLFVCTLAVGLVDTHVVVAGAGANPLGILPELVFSFLCFYWYRLDSEARHYRRSAGLNVAVVMFSIVAIPYYLVRSRPAGARGRALLRLLGFAALLVAGVMGGVALSLA